MIWNNAINILALKKKLVEELVESALIVSLNLYLYTAYIDEFKDIGYEYFITCFHY